jgi:hypothetical protein
MLAPLGVGDNAERSAISCSAADASDRHVLGLLGAFLTFKLYG